MTSQEEHLFTWYISYSTQGSNKMPKKKQHQGGGVYHSLQFEGTQSLVERNPWPQECVEGSPWPQEHVERKP